MATFRCSRDDACSPQALPPPRPTWPTRAARRGPTGSASLTRTGRSRRRRGRHNRPRAQAQAHARPRPGGRACWSRASTTGGISRATCGGARAAHVHGVRTVCARCAHGVHGVHGVPGVRGHAEAHAGPVHEHHAARPTPHAHTGAATTPAAACSTARRARALPSRRLAHSCARSVRRTHALHYQPTPAGLQPRWHTGLPASVTHGCRRGGPRRRLLLPEPAHDMGHGRGV